MPNKPSEKMPPKPPTTFTAVRKQHFLDAFRETGLVWVSAEAAGVVAWTVQAHRREDKEFDRQCEEAKQYWIDSVLVKAAIKRGVKGVQEPIVGGKERDTVVAYKRVYSDALLLSLLKANRSEFRDGSTAGEAAGSGPVMFIPSQTPTTLDDWEQKYGEAAKGQGGRE